MDKVENVVLIGMPGCGKSTCGVLAAKALLKKFVDTDLVIQEREGMALQDIIREKGNDYFRRAEEEAVCLLEIDHAVIATGGSVVYSRRAMEHLKKRSVVVYLRISFDTMMRRISDMAERGILLREGESIEAMYSERTPLYERYADLILDCDGREIERTLSEIVANVRAFAKG